MESGQAGAQRFPADLPVGSSKGTGLQGRGASGEPLSRQALSAHREKGGKKTKGRRQGYSNMSVGGTMSVGGRTLKPNFFSLTWCDWVLSKSLTS